MSDNLALSRRSFLGLIAAAGAIGVTMPAFTAPRAPYITAADGSVSYVGLWKPGGGDSFIGSRVVRRVKNWDGVGYLVGMCNGRYGKHRADVTLYDVDLVNFNRELTEAFGSHFGTWGRPELQPYPNLHSWVRHRRLGEHPARMVARMEAMRLGLPHPDFA
ncbi:twin-arginine translocation signal domain-containing protein [Sphingomonas sp. RB3P16]|uniref:twin-arginine translocation signal domain-containing protein n=1 Tax=Parasphingomonas frigoris TaxID=3096163 RepID=UPI002FC7F5F8